MPTTIPLSGTFKGLHRTLSAQDLSPEFSPDTTDARNSARKPGTCGPRLGRTRSLVKTYSLLGMGMLTAPFGRFRITGDTNGDWTGTKLTWAGTAPATPTTPTISGMEATQGVRCYQFRNKTYVVNGRSRNRVFDGNRWVKQGLLGGTSWEVAGPSAAPTVTLGGGTVINVTLAVLAANVVTLTVPTGHGLTVGRSITVSLGNTAYNGTFTVASLPSATTITYAYTHVGIASAAVSGRITAPVTTGKRVTAYTSDGAGNMTMTSVAHGFVVGGVLTFSVTGPLNLLSTGSLVDSANVYTITAVTADTFTFTRTWPAYTGIDLTGDYLYASVGTGASATLTGTYYYYYVACNSTHLDCYGRAKEGIPSAISLVASPVNQSVTLSGLPGTSADSQVDRFNIYRTTNGGFDSGTVPDQQDFFYLGYVDLGTTTYTDTKADSTGWYQDASNINRMRFNQNIPPTFKFAAIYGERMFGAGFDPIITGTVTSNDASTLATFSAALPDGVIGASVQFGGENARYIIVARPTTTTVTLDRAKVTTVTGGTYTIYREPNEVWFSEFNDPEAWGKDGEGRRNKRVLPGDQTITGLFPYAGHLLVFTATKVFVITGKGPSASDVRLIPDPVCTDSGAVSCDAIMRVDNEVHFLSLDGPAMVSSVGSFITPELYGVKLNTDWLDGLTAAELAISCCGTDGRACWYSVPVSGQTLNSKTFRFERDTQTWWEETEMCPTRFVRQDDDNGVISALFYLQDRFAIRPASGTLDLVSTALSGYWGLSAAYTLDIKFTLTTAVLATNVATLTVDVAHPFAVGDSIVVSCSDANYSGTVTITAIPSTTTFSYAKVHADIGSAAVTGTVYQASKVFPTTNGGLEQCYVRVYKGAVNYGADNRLLSTRRIISNTATTITFSSDTTLPGGGSNGFLSMDSYEIGNIGWKWLTRTLEIPARLNNVVGLHATFDTAAGASTTLLKTDIVDGVESSNVHMVTAAQKAAQFDTTRANRDYAARLSSRTNAIIRHCEVDDYAEAGTS